MKSKHQSQTTASAFPTQRDAIRISNMAGAISTALFVISAIYSILWATKSIKLSEFWFLVILTALILLAFYILWALKVAQQWEKAVVLRLGKYQGLRGPGLFWIIPVVDSTPVWIDHRVMVTPFNAEKALTKDTT